MPPIRKIFPPTYPCSIISSGRSTPNYFYVLRRPTSLRQIARAPSRKPTPPFQFNNQCYEQYLTWLSKFPSSSFIISGERGQPHPFMVAP
ncbi:hypothetical protein CEXT_259161 [Caerostris extrusa]|uniref:Uncharacterized protein n=1 Tax=Caerostris extrusa TaxID=172846 RepID=A0AAV4Y7E9_CAEEX|nr:hypothetical protein CEXT_259161 [Caerostris extrusa]